MMPMPRRTQVVSRFSRLSDLVVKTLGEKRSVAVKTKAAETRPLVLFCAHLLSRYPAPAAAGPLREAAEQLVRFIQILKAAPRNMSPAQIQET